MWRTSCAWILAAAGPAASPAAVELGQDWGLVFGLEGEAVYDSNLTARRDGVEDWYGSLAPKATLSRRGSASEFDLELRATSTWFMNFNEYDSTDPQVSLHYAYPATSVDDPRSRLDLQWGRVSATNADLGRRLRSENMRGQLDQRLFETGRTGAGLVLSGRSIDYEGADLNANESWVVGARADYALTPSARLGLVYTHEWMRSLGPEATDDTDGDEDRVVLRASGALLPTLRGSIEAGVASVSYVGAVTREDTAWVAAADLTWEPREELVAVLRAGRYNDFTPDGGTALRSEAMLDVTRELRGGFSLRIGGGISRLVTFSSDTEDQADSVVLLAGIGYSMTERLSVEIADRWTNQQADRPELDYERHLASGVINLTF